MIKNKNFKRTLCILFCLVLTISAVACQSTSTEDDLAAMFKPGTYIGVANAHNGEIKVEVTVDEENIKEIKIVEHKESQGIADPAIERIPQEIIDNQSLAVDSISGATVTSLAIVAAVTNALEEAGADIDALKVKKDADLGERGSIEETTDIVVIGGGGAGLAAAVSAHENGAEVILLEKMPRLGGNTILSGGAYNAVDPKRQEAQGIEDSIEKHYTQTYEGGDELGNTDLIKVLVEDAYPALEWLEGLGMKFDDELFTVLGGLWPRAHKPSTPLGTGFIDTFSEYIDQNDGIEIILDAEATELIMEDGKVVGVKAKGLKDDMIIHANKGVIIATGGFSKNIEMVEENNKDWPSLRDAKSTNHPGATGDGIILAEAVGANLVGMENLQLLPMGDPDTGSLSGNIEKGVENRIFVNKDGNRFVDEGERRDVMTKALLEQEDATMYSILDHTNYPTPETTNNFNETIEELIEQGRAFKGDTLEELAEKINVDPDNLIKSVEEFNKAVEAGEADAFGRTLFDRKIEVAPFYAGPRMPTVHHTMGGIEINTDAQVMDKDGKVIPGLYAAGEVTGGIHGANRLGGNALADITVFGRIAGENLAKEK